MIQRFIINKNGKANLKDYLLTEPITKNKDDKKWQAWKRKLNNYDVLQLNDQLIGREVEGELFSGSLLVNKII